MNILLKNVKIVDVNSSHNGQVKDVGVVNGKITFETEGNTFEKTIEKSGTSITPGFMDLRSFMGEPGLEHKEDFYTYQKAAAKGGYTTAAILPNTFPVIDNKDILISIQKRSETEVVNLYPIAALSKQAKGEELSEMIDLDANGAIAFSDGHNPIYLSDLLLKGLQYGKSIDALIINTPLDYNLSKKGYVNEGENATALGMPGIPSLAEEIAIQRDLKLLEYAGGKLHFSLITTKEGVELIKKAKKKGLNVTCDVGAHYLALDDSMLHTFDANYKVFPPLRTKKDVKALKKALKEGVIDTVVSDHRPENIENKKLEFDKAEYGIASIETTFSTLWTHGGLTKEEIVDKLAIAPRNIVGLPVPSIEEGEEANIAMVNFEEDVNTTILSKSKNNPFAGEKLKGRVIGVINNNANWLDEDNETK